MSACSVHKINGISSTHEREKLSLQNQIDTLLDLNRTPKDKKTELTWKFFSFLFAGDANFKKAVEERGYAGALAYLNQKTTEEKSIP